MARGNQEKWNLMTTRWAPREHNRKRGRPAIRWIKGILDLVGPYWTRMAANRKGWKRAMEIYALWWVE